MIQPHTLLYRLGTALALSGMSALALPVNAIGNEFKRASAVASEKAKKASHEVAQMKPSRSLTGKEMLGLKGKSGPNPYLSGSSKWGVNIDGVDITTGNLSVSNTDLSFEGGYGIPVNVTRSYSANNPDEGPLGIGWTLSVDLRSTAGGLLKSSSAPVRGVPVAVKERPSTQNRVVTDDIGINEPFSAMIATDASGNEETIQRDVDGVMMPPAWDQNVIETQYETVILDEDEVYEIAKSQTITTPEGTVYVYSKQGEHVRNVGTETVPSYEIGGSGDIREALAANSEAREPSNVLKISSVTDRHVNVTTYSYGTSYVYYLKANGIVREYPLTSITMPGGRALYFAMGNGTNAPTNRIRTVTDFNSGSGRTVTYTYTSGALTSFSSAGGKTTAYTYQTSVNHGSGAVAILRTITDPRGLVTTFKSCDAEVMTPVGYCGPSIYTYAVLGPNGLEKRFNILPYGSNEFGQYPVGSMSGGEGGVPRIQRGNGTGACSTLVYVNDSTFTSAGVNYRPLSSYDWGSPSDTDLSGIDETPYLSVRASRIDPSGLSSTGHPFTTKVYSSISQNLIREHIAGNLQSDGLRGTEKTTWYNFRGQPLRERAKDGRFYGVIVDPPGPAPERTMVTDYAYWGRDKYFQQKAVRGPYQESVTASSSIRYSFTDYYSDTATDGRKGQTYRVFRTGVDSNVYNDFTYIPTGSTRTATMYSTSYPLDSSIEVDQTDWKRTIEPSSSARHAAEFDYDGDGRSVSVKKLQKVVSGTPTYVETTTRYGATGSPWWGMPDQVVEDYGNNKINRTTETEEYDRSGRAVIVEDGNGRKIQTVYDPDGLAVYINNWTGSSWGVMVVNTYGTGGALEATQDYSQGDSMMEMTYGASNADNVGDRGQVMKVTTISNNDYSEIEYEYDAYGRRSAMETSYCATPRRFEYRDYVWVGMPGQEQPVFTNVVECAWVSSAWVPTAEEYSYTFDMTGRMMTARYAPTKTASSWDTGSRSWYGDLAWGDSGTNAYRPSSYASQRYVYDIGGRLSNLVTEWNKWVSSAWVVTQVRSANYTYSGDFKLRTGYTLKNAADSTMFSETYGYDDKLDFLTNASYSDQSGQNGTWTYDAAGNRANSGYAYDNLNRMTASPFGTYTHDAVGNRTGDEKSYLWDNFNRMVSIIGDLGESEEVGSVEDFWYLPSGLRTTKIYADDPAYPALPSGFHDEDEWENFPTTRYRYDGQMTLEEDLTYEISSTNYVEETRYTLGARGIESIVAERITGPTGGGVTADTPYRTFPIYDGHGNMIATLMRDGSDFYTLENEKRYNAWGAVRTQTGAGNHKLNPNKGYVANLGHTKDEETGLIYMRARYYEPGTGRFISEDPATDGANWYAYCGNLPTMFADESGEAMNPIAVAGALAAAFYFIFKFFSSGPVDTNRGLRYFAAAVTAMAIAAVEPAAESWFMRAASKMAALIRLDKIKNPSFNTFQYAPTRNQAQIAFWTGYVLSMIFMIEYLEAWAQGEAE